MRRVEGTLRYAELCRHSLREGYWGRNESMLRYAEVYAGATAEGMRLEGALRYAGWQVQK